MGRSDQDLTKKGRMEMDNDGVVGESLGRPKWKKNGTAGVKPEERKRSRTRILHFKKV
jgi:hypothetical protein